MTLQTAPSFDKPDEITIFGFNTGYQKVDMTVGLGIPLIVLVWGFITTAPIWVLIPAVLITASITLSIVTMAPDYLNIKEYLRTIKYYLKQPNTVDNTVTATIPEDNPEYLQHVGVEQSTRDIVGIDSFFTEAKAVKREDGHYAAALRVKPPNRDFDGERTFKKIAHRIKENTNSKVNFKFQFYVTTRKFPIETFISKLTERLDDKDIQERPIMEAILRDTIDTRPEDLKERGTELPHYYLITTVDTRDINYSESGTTSPIEQLTQAPVIGYIAEMVVNIQDDAEEHKREAKTIEMLHRRLYTLKSVIVQSADDLESEPVTAVEWAELLQTLWTGEDSGEHTLRKHGVTRSNVEIPGEDEDITTDVDETSDEKPPAIEITS
jgi:hypothetical protein